VIVLKTINTDPFSLDAWGSRLVMRTSTIKTMRDPAERDKSKKRIKYAISGLVKKFGKRDTAHTL
jgi:hypothetical protein